MMFVCLYVANNFANGWARMVLKKERFKPILEEDSSILPGKITLEENILNNLCSLIP